MSQEVSALLVTLEIAAGATAITFPLGIVLGWVLARRVRRGRALFETLTALPLVLPPTAVGYLLLRLLSHDGWLGAGRLGIDLDLLFTRKGAILAAVVMSVPLVARTARLAFESIDPRLESLAQSLGCSPAAVWWRVTFPLARRGLLAAAVLGFTRAVGEFGATIIVAGNIPGQTQTLALAIFNDLQLGRDAEALRLVAVTVVLAFLSLWCSEWLLRPLGARR